MAADGTVFVADSGNNRIQRFAADGTFLGKWTGGDTPLTTPRGIALTPNGLAWVTDTDNSRIVVFGPEALDTWRGEYYANRWLADAAVFIHSDDNLDLLCNGSLTVTLTAPKGVAMHLDLLQGTTIVGSATSTSDDVAAVYI